MDATNNNLKIINILKGLFAEIIIQSYSNPNILFISNAYGGVYLVSVSNNSM